jgi:hypothetical protein
MTSDWPWKYLWVMMCNEVNKLQLSAAQLSISKAKGHVTKSENIVSNDWKRGTDFKDRGAKFRAKNHVLLEIEKRTDKELAKAESVLSGVLTDLSEHNQFHEDAALSLQLKKKIKTME